MYVTLTIYGELAQLARALWGVSIGLTRWNSPQFKSGILQAYPTGEGCILQDTQNIASINKGLSSLVQTVGGMSNELPQVIKPSKLNSVVSNSEGSRLRTRKVVETNKWEGLWQAAANKRWIKIWSCISIDYYYGENPSIKEVRFLSPAFNA